MRTTRMCLVLLALLLTAARGAVAQATPGLVQGTIRGEASRPLGGVNVALVGTQLTAVTRPDGSYTIANAPPGTYQVRAMHIGYAMQSKSATVTAGATTAVDFDLAPTAVTLNQVVVVGYGTQSRRDVTGSIASVGSEQIATIPVPRVEEAISGLVPGVQVQTTNTEPGSQLRIRIRGGNSLSGNNAPLVVVDGVIDADLNQISPGDIASIDILKDASATAIYGARASNGVILVTTKRGRPGKMQVEYSGYTGMQNTTKHIHLLTADQFALLYMRNPNHDQSVTFDTLTSMPTTDWQDVVFRSAPIRNNEIRVSGSNGGTSLMASGSMFGQQGIVRQSDFDRGTLRFNLDQAVGSRLRLGTRVTYSRSVGDAVRVNDGYGSAGGPLTMAALRFAPTVPVYDSIGGYSGPLLSSQQFDNPLAIVNLHDDKTTTDYLLGNLFGEYDIFRGLTFRSSIGYTARTNLEQQYTSRLLLAALNNGHANVANGDRTSLLAENTLTLRHAVGDKSDFTLLGGFTAQSTRNGSNTADGVGFTSDLLGYNRLNLAETITGASSSSLEHLLSFVSRANVNLLGRYLLTATLRADGSSKFAVNNKWAYFPSAGIAWRLGDEGFFRRLAPAVSELKLRTSLGRTGSEAISPYQSLASWSIGSRRELIRIERPRVLEQAKRYLREAPITITSFSAARSAGGPNDFYSEGDYWWPDPKNPNGPYIRRDGETNPENFVAHRDAMRRFSQIVPALVAAYELTDDPRYAQRAVDHLRAWFVNESTRMNPSLRYAQAIKGRVTGRGIGIIDTIHLVEVAQSVLELERLGFLRGPPLAQIKSWFAQYLHWLTTDPYGIAERDNGNNHSVSWAVQVAEFARVVGDDREERAMRAFYRSTLLPQQMAADGSFPRELARTKPYGYSLFELDLMATLAEVLSTPGDDLWTYTTPDGRGLRKALAYMYPFIADKSSWPKPPDVMYFDQWPVRQPALLFGGLAFHEARYVDLWKRLDPDPKVEEIIRNYPIRQPLLWVHR